MAGNDEARRYERNTSTVPIDDPWHGIRALTPQGSKLLDVGCGSGSLAAWLEGHVAIADGVEPEPARAAVARTRMRRVVNAMAGHECDHLLDPPYDVVTITDVVEHLDDPTELLQWAASMLSAEGLILATVPNSANWKFRRKIVRGDWAYSDIGYFDRTHLRFYDVRTVRLIPEAAGLTMVEQRHFPAGLPRPVHRRPSLARWLTARWPNLWAGHVLLALKRP